MKFIMEGKTTYLRDGKLKVFLGHMLPPLSQSVHARFCTDTPDLGTGALTHLFGERSKVNSTLEGHLSTSLDQHWTGKGA